MKRMPLPIMESAAALTSARIDLLPHQVVLTHRIATASPRRFLIADEVGLGKTIETALILRELASRGELNAALMVVPAGLVNNWHRELNEVFHLDFEVFGSEGDVTDRKTNAFAKHDRLIASIDTLKRPARIKRLLEAPPWDLVVFDEAHHLTAYRNGREGHEDGELQARRGAERATPATCCCSPRHRTRATISGSGCSSSSSTRRCSRAPRTWSRTGTA